MSVGQVERADHGDADLLCLAIVLVTVQKVQGVHLVVDNAADGIALLNAPVVLLGAAFLLLVAGG